MAAHCSSSIEHYTDVCVEHACTHRKSHPCVHSEIYISQGGSRIPVGGANSRGLRRYNFAKLSKQLHEIEKFLVSWEGARRGFPGLHPAGTSIVSDICDLSKISDIAPLTLGSMEKSFFYHLFCVTQETYLSKDLGEIYI